MLITASSISLRAAGTLRPGVAGRVLASFERVCNLVTDASEVVALAWGGIGDGPLNVVLAQGPGVSLPAGTRFAVPREGDVVRSELVILYPVPPATGSQIKISSPHPGVEALAGPVMCGKRPAKVSSPGHYLAISPIMIDLTSAIPWNPQPDWDHLRTRRRQIAAGAKAIAGILAESGWTPARCGLPEAVCEQAARGQAAALSALVGLGPGLTPAGDDWLAGWLLAQHLVPDVTALRNLSRLVGKMAADRTTTLSRALLACVAAGEADAAWHALLSALAEVPMTNLPIYQSTQTILSHGATSGAAMLIGFCQGVTSPDSCHLILDTCSLIPDP
jgi:hypothetical protein